MPWTGYYGDYYSCAYVRIHGGGPLSWSHQPTWWPGRSSLFRDACETSVTRIGECPNEPCVDHPRQVRVPEEFENGAMPPRLWRDMYPNIDNQTDTPPPPAAGELPPDQEDLVSPVEYLRPTPAVVAEDVAYAMETPAAAPQDELVYAPELDYTATTEPDPMYEVAATPELDPMDEVTATAEPDPMFEGTASTASKPLQKEGMRVGGARAAPAAMVAPEPEFA